MTVSKIVNEIIKLLPVYSEEEDFFTLKDRKCLFEELRKKKFPSTEIDTSLNFIENIFLTFKTLDLINQ